MTVHTEWVSAEGSKFDFAVPGDYTDAYSQKNDEPALILGYDEVVIITGSIDELRARLQQGLEVLDIAAEEMRQYEARRKDDLRFRDTLLEVHRQLDSVKGMHEDADEALGIVDALYARLWDEEGNPTNFDDPVEESVPYQGSMADTAAGPGSN